MNILGRIHLLHADWIELLYLFCTLWSFTYALRVRAHAVANQDSQEQNGVNGGLDIVSRAAVERTTYQAWAQLALLAGGVVGLLMEPGGYGDLNDQAFWFRACIIFAAFFSVLKSRREQVNRQKLVSFLDGLKRP